MPLIIFSVNTEYSSGAQNIPAEMLPDGSFKFRHHLPFKLPEDTVFTLKHVAIDAGGESNFTAQNKQPSIWVSVDFPQLKDEIIHAHSYNQHYEAFDNLTSLGYQVNDGGAMRFPITSYPVSGKTFSTIWIDSNTVDRQGVNGTVQRQYQHKGTHILNIPLGRFHLEDQFIECIVTPRDRIVNVAPQVNVNPRTCRIKIIQVILEYK